MIIDMRCRPVTGKSAEYFIKMIGDGKAPPGLKEGTEEAFFREMDSAGISVAVGPSGNNQGMTLGNKELPPRNTSNEKQADLQQRFPERFVGVAGIDVGNGVHDSITEFNKCVTELGLKVATIEPGRRPLNAPHPADERIFPFYELAQKLNIPVIIQTSGMKGGRDFDYANPRWIDRVADNFPDLHIICAHGCYPFVREMIAVTIRRRNVFPSPDIYYDRMGAQEWLRAVNNENISEQFLFGSGYPFGPGLKPFVDRFFLKSWDPAILDRILYRNAIRALKLETTPGFEKMFNQPDYFTSSRVLLRKISSVRDIVLEKLSR